MNSYIKTILTILTCAYFWYYAITYKEWHFIDTVNLIFHEAGHAIFFFFGNFIQVLAGSGMQIFIPLLIAGYFFLRNEKLQGSIILLWIGQNILNVSLYIGDAITMQLELLGGDSVIHDWNYILNALGILSHTAIIANVFYVLGLFVIVGATVLALKESTLRTNC